MAQNSYAIYLKNNGSGLFAASVFTNPTTLPAGGTHEAIPPVAYYPNVTALNITAATNATPIAVTTSAAHGLSTGAVVFIRGALGNTAANGTYLFTSTGASTGTLDGSAGNGTYTNAGSATDPYATLQGPIPLTGNIGDLIDHAKNAVIVNRARTV